MLRRAVVCLSIITAFACYSVDAYTVIMKKGGKTIQGTLVSEDDNSIVFKDEQGLQYSIKKSALDLEKMKEANAPPPPAAEPQPEVKDTAPAKKSARTYTAADLEGLRDKYGDLATSKTSEFTDPTSGPEGYYRALMEAVAAISEAANDLGGISDGMNTSWEVASSTGRDPAESVKNYRAGKAYADLIQGVNSGLNNLQGIVSEMGNPPQGMEKGYDAVSRAVETLNSYSDAVKAYSGDQDMATFRGQMQNFSSQIDTAISEIQTVPAPEGMQPEGEKETETPPQN